MVACADHHHHGTGRWIVGICTRVSVGTVYLHDFLTGVLCVHYTLRCVRALEFSNYDLR